MVALNPRMAGRKDAELLLAEGVEVVCGGFPCQDVSNAGKRAGLSGERSGLWRELLRTIRLVRPLYAIVENVAALLGRGMGVVLGDLAESGYDTEWHSIPARALGAPHEREREWIVAYPMRERLEGLRKPLGIPEKIPFAHDKAVANAEEITRLHGLFEQGICSFLDGITNSLEWAGQQWPETEPLICRVDDGIPDWVGRTGSCGNAVIPQIPEVIGASIMEQQRTDR